MYDDQNIAEEGEILDDEPDSYTPLERPANYSTTASADRFPGQNQSESEDDLQTASDSDSDSDCQVYRAKKPKIRPKPKTLRQENSRRKKYDIWSTRVQDDVLAETLNSCDVTYKDRSRDVESYDYTLGHKQYTENRVNNKRTRADRNNPHVRLSRRMSEEKPDTNSAPRHIMDLTVTSESTAEEIASDMANKLCEEKEDLLRKIVDIAGKEKAFKIFKETQRIEAGGGMLIMNQSRRRTPGGVYLFLLRHDSDLTREQLGKIFDEDKQKYKEVMKKKKMQANKKKKALLKSNKSLPDLLTKAELCVKKLAEENDRSRKDSSNVDVINPPPTPETDCHENSGDGMENSDEVPVINKDSFLDISGRKVENYELDFLDLGNGNNMDLF